MNIKHVQLYLNQHYKEIRHWLLVVLGVALLIFSLLILSVNSRINAKITVLAEQNKTLSEQNKQLNVQTKNLGQENQSIAKQNRAYTTCLAQLFATYTQNHRPITIVSLTTCTIVSQSQATNNSATGTTPKASPTTSSATSTVSPQSSQSPSNPTPATPPKTPLNCTIDILSFHLFC